MNLGPGLNVIAVGTRRSRLAARLVAPTRIGPAGLEPGVAAGTPCARCRRPLVRGRAFALGSQRRCLGCTLRYAPLLRRSGLTSLVVGTALVAINQGTVLASGSPPASLLWQVPLTYAVPFCVATWGALANSRAGTP